MEKMTKMIVGVIVSVVVVSGVVGYFLFKGQYPTATYTSGLTPGKGPRTVGTTNANKDFQRLYREFIPDERTNCIKIRLISESTGRELVNPIGEIDFDNIFLGYKVYGARGEIIEYSGNFVRNRGFSDSERRNNRKAKEWSYDLNYFNRTRKHDEPMLTARRREAGEVAGVAAQQNVNIGGIERSSNIIWMISAEVRKRDPEGRVRIGYAEYSDNNCTNLLVRE